MEEKKMLWSDVMGACFVIFFIVFASFLIGMGVQSSLDSKYQIIYKFDEPVSAKIISYKDGQEMFSSRTSNLTGVRFSVSKETSTQLLRETQF